MVMLDSDAACASMSFDPAVMPLERHGRWLRRATR